ncbi:hypothetical protein, partial [Phascolarctobacterium succinatutens]|uniref:hypothetical protein n=1 Tax=Phascolarctobacterium succinatutens TaxID=626940 RepID=UPI003AAD07BD
NVVSKQGRSACVVVPRWFLVWYNEPWQLDIDIDVVVPRWFLVWYNRPLQKALEAWLQGLFVMRKNSMKSIK